MGAICKRRVTCRNRTHLHDGRHTGATWVPGGNGTEPDDVRTAPSPAMWSPPVSSSSDRSPSRQAQASWRFAPPMHASDQNGPSTRRLAKERQSTEQHHREPRRCGLHVPSGQREGSFGEGLVPSFLRSTRAFLPRGDGSLRTLHCLHPRPPRQGRTPVGPERQANSRVTARGTDKL